MKTSPHWFGVLIALCWMGCDSGTQAPTAPAKSVSIGTTFTLKGIVYDRQRNPVNEFFWYDSVGDIELSYFGKERVFQMLRRSTQPLVPIYYNYEPNGDFSMFEAFSIFVVPVTAWVTYPVASKKGWSTVIMDSTIDVGPAVHYYCVNTTSYEGKETITLHSGTFETIRLRDSVSLFVSTSQSQQQYTYVTRYFYAPSVGFFVKTIYPYTDQDLITSEDELWEYHKP